MTVDWFLEPFALGFQQRALIGGLTAGVMSSVVGVAGAGGIKSAALVTPWR